MLGILFFIQIYSSKLAATSDNIIIHLKRKIWKKLKEIWFFFSKNRVRWKFSAVLGLEKTVLDRIPQY